MKVALSILLVGLIAASGSAALAQRCPPAILYLIVRGENGKALTEPELKTVHQRIAKQIGTTSSGVSALYRSSSGNYRPFYARSDGDEAVPVLAFGGGCMAHLREVTLSHQGREMQLVFNVDLIPFTPTGGLLNVVVDSPNFQDGAFELAMVPWSNAQALVTNDRWKRIRRDYDPDALGAVPSDLVERYKEARRAASAKDHQTAVAILRSLTTRAPDKPLLWRELGDSYLETKLFNDAVAAYRKALALDPDLPGITDRLAMASFGGGAKDAYREADRYAHEAAALDKRLGARAYYSLGLGSIGRSDVPDQTAEVFRKAIELDDRHADSYWQLSIYLLALEPWVTSVEPSERQRGFALPDPAVRQKEVLTFLQRFLALAPQSSHAAEVRDLIVRVKAEIEARAK